MPLSPTEVEQVRYLAQQEAAGKRVRWVRRLGSQMHLRAEVEGRHAIFLAQVYGFRDTFDRLCEEVRRVWEEEMRRLKEAA